jgi:UDP-N-acetylmuramate--alanine ligase
MRPATIGYMHVFFSGIGGTAIGPLALIANAAGYQVSGSDKQDSQYIDYLRHHGIRDITIGQTREDIDRIHQANPIDWFVYSSAVAIEAHGRGQKAPELAYCEDNRIKATKRDALLNQILTDKQLRLIAVAGTHGKTTTTAMVIWLLKELGVPLSYSVGAKISFGDMGQYQEGSQYFVYECDEFDRNFLEFEPHLSLITGVSWDHHEIFPTRENYQQAFKDFIGQSQTTIAWPEDLAYLGLATDDHILTPSVSGSQIDDGLKLAGHYNRMDAWLAVEAVRRVHDAGVDQLVNIIERFPGLQRRMEQLIPGLYSDYAHTPEKIRGGMSIATEMAAKNNQKLIIVYEPLTNRRQHYMLDDYKDCFAGAEHVYWIPSYLAREDENQRIIPPEELISHLSDPSIASPMQRDDELKNTIQQHLDQGDMVVGMAGGGGDSLDEWLRQQFL